MAYCVPSDHDDVINYNYNVYSNNRGNMYLVGIN